VAGSLALGLVLGLAGLTVAMRATGPLLPNIPAAITARTAGLAPALLAALVAIELTGSNGVIHLDVKIPAVIVAGGLAALRVPFIVCVVAGAFVAALLRALFRL
jgi:branched-subunit amino acid transport protein